MTDKKKILILTASAGGGHIKAAQALQSYGRECNAEVSYIDILSHMPFFFKLIYGFYYINIIKYVPALYGLIYDITNCDKQSNSKKWLNTPRYFFQELFTAKLKRKVVKAAPDYIIFTHSLPAEHFNSSIAATKYAEKYGVVVTDYSVHQLWAQSSMDLFFVANRESKSELSEYGIPEEKIYVTGIPVEKQFSVKEPKEEVRKDLGLNPYLKTVLFMTGANGVGRIDIFIKYLLSEINSEFQVIAMTGNSRKLFKKLEQLGKKYPGKMKVVKFTDQVSKYMAASDFTVSKAGGLTTAECLSMDLPIITLNPIPGQEIRNCDFLRRHKAGFTAKDLPELKHYVKLLLDNERILKTMQKNASDISSPNAALSILKILG